uniref:Protein FLC EXPRESSOR n=1 Tax=Kalanchoe fedtschenkoi TaxID=63787 RepID=A0A7N0VH43_KALFE
MAERSHRSRSDAHHLRRDQHPSSSSSISASHLARFEDTVASQQKELQTLLIDNQRLGATHVALKQELAHSRNEINQLKSVAARLKAERDDQVRELYEQSLKIDAEARAVEAMNEDLGRARVDVQKLSLKRRDLELELKGIESEVEEARLKLKQLPEVRVAVEIMRQEVQRGRAAVEFEKKTRASNHELGKLMEKNMITIGREIERLRAALANAERKAVEQNATIVAGNPDPGYAANHGNPEMRYDGSMHAHPYIMQQPTGGAVVSQYTAGPVPHGPYTEQLILHPHGPYNVQQPNAHR